MKISEARAVYAAEIRKYHEQKTAISKQKKALEEQNKLGIGSKEDYEDQMVKLDLSYEEVSDKYDAYHKYMEYLNTLHMAISNAESAKQQGEAVKKAADDMGKILEVARRIASGAKVPPEDERKVMEFSMELYMTCKSMAMVNKSDEEYDSLWGDDEGAPEAVDPMEKADNTEVGMDGPAISSDVSVSVSAE